MKVMLREHVDNLGKKGDIVNVAAGYARNYLLPKKVAVKILPTNEKMIALEQKALRKGFEKEMSTYKELTGRLNTLVLSFVRKTGEKDIIFGSVSSTDIKDELERLGFSVEKKKILLEEPIKRLGNYTVPIKIFQEERAQIKIEVVKETVTAEAKLEGSVAEEEASEANPDAAQEMGTAEDKSVLQGGEEKDSD